MHLSFIPRPLTVSVCSSFLKSRSSIADGISRRVPAIVSETKGRSSPILGTRTDSEASTGERERDKKEKGKRNGERTEIRVGGV